ncbi:MAG: penicillin-binding protein 2, partial [Bacteroidales bacterium]|nr:penicillin-binding protein 2 [Bacteroidales bacterium]
HGHGSPIPFIHSISTSCNSFYCWGLYRMIDNAKYNSPTQALNVWRDHMVNMGLGYALGVDLPGEKRGLIPNASLYDKIYGENRWGGLRIIHTAIGQGEILLTPVQMANLAATVANEGYFITPHIVKHIDRGELDEVYNHKRYTGIDQEYYQYVKEGMRGAVIGSPYGATCRRANIPGLEICGKTGTAQNRGKDHSVFMGFAPKENPKIAVAVYVEHGGFGATWGVPIGAMIIEKYLNGYIDESRQYLLDYIRGFNLIPDEYKRKK